MAEEEIYEDDQDESQAENEDKEAYFMGTQSQARKRFNTNHSRPVLSKISKSLWTRCSRRIGAEH